jgi:hypothetical protein
MYRTLRRSVLDRIRELITNPTVTIHKPHKLYFSLINHVRTGISLASNRGNSLAMLCFTRIPHPFKDMVLLWHAWHLRLRPATLPNRIQGLIPWDTQPPFKLEAQGEVVIYQVNVLVATYRRVRLGSIGKMGFLLTFPPVVISRRESGLNVKSLTKYRMMSI